MEAQSCRRLLLEKIEHWSEQGPRFLTFSSIAPRYYQNATKINTTTMIYLQWRKTLVRKFNFKTPNPR